MNVWLAINISTRLQQILQAKWWTWIGDEHRIDLGELSTLLNTICFQAMFFKAWLDLYYDELFSSLHP